MSCGSLHPLAQAGSPEGPLLAEGASDRRREGEPIRPSSRPHRSRHDVRVAWIDGSTNGNTNGNIDGNPNGAINGNTNDNVNGNIINRDGGGSGSTHVVGGVSSPSMRADNGPPR